MLDTAVLFSGRVVQTFTCQCDDNRPAPLTSLCVRAELWTSATFCLSRAGAVLMGGITPPMYSQKTVMMWQHSPNLTGLTLLWCYTVCPSGTQCWHWSCPFASFPTFGMESGAHSHYYSIKRSQRREQWGSLKLAGCLSATDSALSKLNGERNGWTLSASSQSPWPFFRTALCRLITAFKWASSPSAVKPTLQIIDRLSQFGQTSLLKSWLSVTFVRHLRCPSHTFRYERTGEAEHGRTSTKLKVNFFFIHKEGWK